LKSKTAWDDNNHEGKIIRFMINRLMGRFKRLSKDPNWDLDKMQELAKTIGYLAVQKNTLIKQHSEIDNRLKQLEELAHIVQTPKYGK